MKSSGNYKVILFDQQIAYGSYIKKNMISKSLEFVSDIEKIDTTVLSKDSLFILVISNLEHIELLKYLLSKGFKNILVCSDVFKQKNLQIKNEISFVSLTRLKNIWLADINNWFLKYTLFENKSQQKLLSKSCIKI
jgi:hypothetical protein